MQSMTKCDFRLTAHLSDHPTFGGLWNTVHEEFERTRVLVLAITGQADLMETVPAIKESIRLRDSIIQPLLVIQQFALTEMDRQSEGRGVVVEPRHVAQADHPDDVRHRERQPQRGLT